MKRRSTRTAAAARERQPVEQLEASARQREEEEVWLAKEYYLPERDNLAKVWARAVEVDFPEGRARNVVTSAEAAEAAGSSTDPPVIANQQRPQRQCRGLCRFEVAENHYQELRAAHRRILAMKNEAGWNGDEADERVRKYGLLPGQRKLLEEGLVRFGMREFANAPKKDRDADERRNWNATVDLDDCTRDSPLGRAVAAVAASVRPLVPEPYRKVVCFEKCVALQPNKHGQRYRLRTEKQPPGSSSSSSFSSFSSPSSSSSSSSSSEEVADAREGLALTTASHLPLHCDQPLHDGFGVVIVTLAMDGVGQIILLDEGDDFQEQAQRQTPADGESADADADADADATVAAAWTFRLEASRRQGYALSGDARNKTLHGVYVVPHQPGGGHRESLNIRFGLHARGHGSDDGGCSFSAFDEVDRHWGWTREETAEEAEAKKKSGKNKRKGGGYRGEEVVGKEAKKGK